MLELILGGIVVGAILGLGLGRKAVWLGTMCLVIGLGPFVGLWVYESFFYTQGDTSSMGMLSLILLILFAPFGLVLMVFGLLRGE